MMTARGKIQRVAVNEIGVIGRNTQGVRIMSLDDGDALAGIVRVPQEEEEDGKREAKSTEAKDDEASEAPVSESEPSASAEKGSNDAGTNDVEPQAGDEQDD